MSPTDELFGEERMKGIGIEWFRASVQEIATETDRLIEQHRNGRTANDDATMMLIRRKPA
jgi:serine phosphatase RsbU (regulator of sigma subunit)